MWDIVIFRLVAYLLNVIDLFNTLTFMQYCIYMNFRLNLTKFYTNFSRQEHQIDVSCNAWDFQVSSPFSFSFTVPLSGRKHRLVCFENSVNFSIVSKTRNALLIVLNSPEVKISFKHKNKVIYYIVY